MKLKKKGANGIIMTLKYAGFLFTLIIILGAASGSFAGVNGRSNKLSRWISRRLMWRFPRMEDMFLC